MTTDKARELVAGDVVAWRGDGADLGDVVGTGFDAVEIEWRRPGVGRELFRCDAMGFVEPFTMAADRKVSR